VLEAGDAEQALTILQEPEIRVDVVLSGVDFSGPMDAFELSHWVKAHSPGTDVFLAATVQRAASTAGDLCEEGPMLSKPYEPETAVERIKQPLRSAQGANRSEGAFADPVDHFRLGAPALPSMTHERLQKNR
jgi:DNA-binding LytR/AlgR family response regulator